MLNFIGYSVINKGINGLIEAAESNVVQVYISYKENEEDYRYSLNVNKLQICL
jgi:hypothetical protein